MYEAVDDPYCYPGSTILRNIPGLRDQDALAQFETIMTAQRGEEPLPSGRLGATHYRAIHKHLFGDVFSWAGRFRRVRISKDGSMFCYPEHIAGEMRRVFAWLKHQRFLRGLAGRQFNAAAAHVLAELNAIHPFRDGNGRTQLAFAALLANQAGHALELERLDPEAFLHAMIASFSGDERRLADQIAGLSMGPAARDDRLGGR